MGVVLLVVVTPQVDRRAPDRPPVVVLNGAAQRLAGQEFDRGLVGDRLAGLPAPVVALHGEAVAPDVDAEVLVGRAGRVADVEPAPVVGGPPLVVQGDPDADVGVRDGLAGVGGDDVEVEDLAGGGGLGPWAPCAAFGGPSASARFAARVNREAPTAAAAARPSDMIASRAGQRGRQREEPRLASIPATRRASRGVRAIASPSDGPGLRTSPEATASSASR